MPDLDLAALAASLNDTTLNLAEHIEQRAREIAEPQIHAAQFHAAGRIENVGREAAADRQRRDDLIAELRRQLDAQVKANERLHREVKETRGAVRRVEALHVWTNEDRRQFVFADELRAALAEAGSPAGRALADLRRKQEAAQAATISEGN
jgi:phage shock protein A